MLILMRHGRTAVNAEARLQGQIDPPLDEVGREQAHRAGEYLRRRFDIDDVVVTPRVRTLETVEYAGLGGPDLEVDDRWSELDFGEYDGRKIVEVISTLQSRWEQEADYQPPGGESLSALHHRVTSACVDLVERSRDHNVLVVTHATPIKSAAVFALGGEPSMILRMWTGLASLTVLDHVHGEFVLAEFNRDVG